MSRARVLVSAGAALMLCACSGWPRGAGFGLFGSPPPPVAGIDLDSEPQGAEARTSVGPSCQTPCTLQVPTGGAFSVTFTREGFVEQSVPVQVQPGPEAGSVKFAPNPVFAQLAAVPSTKKKKAAKPAKPAPNAPGTSGR
jgi:hypothetical protein